MARILGIGGVFLRSADPPALTAWYRDVLGLDLDEHGAWEQEAGTTAFAAVAADSDPFGSRGQRVMLNFRVRDLDATLDRMRRRGADVDDEVQESPGVGRFGWVTDPEGDRIELWQPE